MKIIIEESPDCSETEITITCKELTEGVIKIVSSLRALEQKILGTLEGSIHILSPEDIFYFESVDKKNFIYTDTGVYETSLRLYEVEEILGDSEFFRATKSTVLNISKIKTISPKLGGRLDVELVNGEKMMVSRQYVTLLKEKLDF